MLEKRRDSLGQTDETSCLDIGRGEPTNRGFFPVKSQSVYGVSLLTINHEPLTSFRRRRKDGGRGIRTPNPLREADFKSAALPIRTSPPNTDADKRKYRPQLQYIKSNLCLTSYRPILLASQLFSKKTAPSGHSSWQQRQLIHFS